MNKKIIYEIKSLYRDDFRVWGYEFGEGEKSVCIVGPMRGNEVQQLYTCSQLTRRLKVMEEKGRIKKGHKILVVPSVNPYSMNIQKRFWPTDNTDINRMFPGYDEGETTQRIAAGVFDEIKDYKYGIQFASFYMPGTFMPHVRMMKAGMENVELAKKFGMPYVVLRNTRPYDTTTLNYNWQIWGTNGFSLYTTTTSKIDKKGAEIGLDAIEKFMSSEGILLGNVIETLPVSVVHDNELITARVKNAGFFETEVTTGQLVRKGEVLARVINCYDGEVMEEVRAPEAGVIFFAYKDPLTYSNTAVFKLVQR